MVAQQDADALSTLPDEELAQRVVNGDAATRPAAYGILYVRHREAIWSLVFGRVRHVQEAQDVMSEVFLAAYEKMGQYLPAKASFRTWLYAIAYHKAMDHWRHHYEGAAKTLSLDAVHHDIDSPEGFAPVDNSTPSPEKQFLAAEFLDSVLAHLSPHQREIADLRQFGLMVREIAYVLDKSPSAISVEWNRACKKVRKVFGGGKAGHATDRPPPHPPLIEGQAVRAAHQRKAGNRRIASGSKERIQQAISQRLARLPGNRLMESNDARPTSTRV